MLKKIIKSGLYSKLVIFIIPLLLASPSLILAKGGRIPTYAKNGMVVSASEIASEVGRDILKKGGNSIDAAVATAFSLAVTYPGAGNIGGGGYNVRKDSFERYDQLDGVRSER